MAVQEVEFGKDFGGERALRQGTCAVVTGDCNAKEVMDSSLTLEFDVELEVLEEGIHGGLGVSSDEEIIDVNTNDVDTGFGVPGKETWIHRARFETDDL